MLTFKVDTIIYLYLDLNNIFSHCSSVQFKIVQSINSFRGLTFWRGWQRRQQAGMYCWISHLKTRQNWLGIYTRVFREGNTEEAGSKLLMAEEPTWACLERCCGRQPWSEEGSRTTHCLSTSSYSELKSSPPTHRKPSIVAGCLYV